MNRTKALAIVFPIWVLAYPIIGALTEFRVLHYLPLFLDSYISLWPPAVYFYVIYYPLCMGSFFLVKDPQILKKGVNAFLCAMFITSLSFLVYPVAFDRPSFFEVRDVSSWILSKIWAVDTVANSFPSQHVTLIFVCAFMVSMAYRSRKWVVVSAVVVAVLISISTLLVKQHYVWDVIAGVLVAAVSCFFAFRRKTHVYSVAAQNEVDE